MVKILMVCTANRCRSPMAEALMARALGEGGIEGVVGSAGVIQGGWPAEPEAIEAVARVGLDISRHESRKITDELLDGCDLILTMERSHVRDIVVRRRDVLPKAFTLKEFARRARMTPRSGDLGLWIEQLSREREAHELLGSSPDDEVADPIGQPLDRFIVTRDEIDAIVAGVAGSLL